MDEKKIINLYENGSTTIQIALLFGSSKKTISRILKRNGIEIRRYKRIYEKYYKESLSKRQQEILVGSLLGDGGIYKHHNGKNSCRYSETHSIDQIEYALWKFDEFYNLISSNYKIIDQTNSKTFGKKQTIVFCTVLHECFVKWRELFYPKGIKIIPDNIDNYLTPLGLAVWYMDDGSRHYVSRSSVARLHTNAFNKNDIDKLIVALNKNFGLGAKTINTKRGIIIQFCQSETKKLFNIIRQYIVPSLSYKIDFIHNPAETLDNF